MRWILAIIIIFPILEVSIIAQFGSFWGAWPIVAVIFSTALIGSILVRMQGISVLRDVRHEMNKGRIPAHQALEGLCLLCAALFLVTPGFVSDAIGFLFLLPAFRRLTISHLKKWINDRIRGFWSNAHNAAGPTIDGTFVNTANDRTSAATIDSSSHPSS